MEVDRTLTAERVRELLDYDPATGVLRWRVTYSSHARAGRVAGCVADGGYRFIRIDRTLYKAHRLAWLLTYGHWPPDGVDHRNGDTSDNRLLNLREATQAENTQNVLGARSDNSNGYRGVSRNHERWMAAIIVNGKRRYLGTFDTPEEAHAAYLAAKRELHPFWAEHA